MDSMEELRQKIIIMINGIDKAECLKRVFFFVYRIYLK